MENENEQNVIRRVAGKAVPADNNIEKEPVADEKEQGVVRTDDGALDSADNFDNEQGVVRPDVGKFISPDNFDNEQGVVRPDTGEMVAAAKSPPPTKSQVENLIDLLLKDEPEVGLKWTEACRGNLRAFCVEHWDAVEPLIEPYKQRGKVVGKKQQHHSRCHCANCKIVYTDEANDLFDKYYRSFRLGEKGKGALKNHAPLWLLLKLSITKHVHSLLIHRQGRDNSFRWRQVILDKIRKRKDDDAKPRKRKADRTFQQRRGDGHAVKRRMKDDLSFEPNDQEKADLAIALRQQVHLDKYATKVAKGRAIFREMMKDDPSFEPNDQEKADLAIALRQQVHLDKYATKVAKGRAIFREMMKDDPSFEPNDQEKADLAIALRQQVHLDKYATKVAKGRAIFREMEAVVVQAKERGITPEGVEASFKDQLSDDDAAILDYAIQLRQRYAAAKQKTDRLKKQSSEKGEPEVLAKYLSSLHSAKRTQETRDVKTAELTASAESAVLRPVWEDPNDVAAMHRISSLVEQASAGIEGEFTDSRDTIFSQFRSNLRQYKTFANLAWQAMMYLCFGNIPVGLLIVAFTDACMVYTHGSITFKHVLKDVHVVYNLLQYAQKVRDAAHGLKNPFRACNKYPSLHVRLSFGSVKNWKGSHGKCYPLYKGVVPDLRKGPSLETLEAFGWKIHHLRKRIQQRVKESGAAASRKFLTDAVAEIEFEGGVEQQLFQAILNDPEGGEYQHAFNNLSNGHFYASARGSCACWWMFVVVLFHLGCSHFVILIFSNFFGNWYFALHYALFGSQAALIVRIWWVALWAGFDGSMLHYGNHGCIEVILPKGDIARWFCRTVLSTAFPTLHLHHRDAESEVKNGKDITCVRVHRKKDVGKMARMILWALSFDGTEWGMQPQNVRLFIPRRKLEALEKMQHFWDPNETDTTDCKEDADGEEEPLSQELQDILEDEHEEREACKEKDELPDVDGDDDDDDLYEPSDSDSDSD